MALIFCRECGTQMSDEAIACPKCAAPNKPKLELNSITNDKNKTTAGLLAIFLGCIGVHKFYLGQKSQGIMYLLFCWTSIPFFIGLFEGVRLLSMSSKEFNDKYPPN